MRQVGIGIALSLQFFSAIPVKKELPLEKKDITAMYAALPLIGLLFGLVLMATSGLLLYSTETSSLFIAFVLVLAGSVLTGGLHLDGLADVGDAYFSYRNPKKRLEIMEDPQIGAFGAMVLLFALGGKTVLITEVINSVPLAAIAVIPIFSRLGLLGLFGTTSGAKYTGLAAFFQQRANLRFLVWWAVCWTVILSGLCGLLLGWTAAAGFNVFFILSVYAYRKWCIRHFGGVTGDLFGAYVEGAEIFLWLMLLFFI